MKICFNGAFVPAEQPVLPVQNRSFKWGDGLFETMKVFRGRLLLASAHFERLFAGLQLLQITCADSFTPQVLTSQVLKLCTENDCLNSARVRLSVFRMDSNIAGYSIEATPLAEETNQWQRDGLILCLYPFARKSADAFANLKSANYLPYILAARYAQDNGADDALVVNQFNYLCDSSKANLFLLKGEVVTTPSLHQGCVAGVMRRTVIETVKQLGLRLHQAEVTEADLLAADEVFLTNAIQLIRWVKRYKETPYGCGKTKVIFDAVAATIFTHSC